MKTLIIDGNNLVHRTFWTAKNQSRRVGIDDISGFHVYFTLNSVLSYTTKYNPDRVIFTWDEKASGNINPRKLRYKNYKDNRSADTSPHQNNNLIKEFLKHLGILSIFPKSLEADDIIAHICKEELGTKIIISVDKDLLQLIDKDVVVYDPIRKQEYDINNFNEKTGYKDIETWLKVKCLRGDKSDNVESVLTETKTKKYLSGEIQLTPEQQEQYELNYELFKLGDFSAFKDEREFYIEQLSTEILPNWNAFINLCKEYEFNAILNKKEAWYTLFFIKNKLKLLFS